VARSEANAGIESRGLARLLQEAWDWEMRGDPIRATTLGDHRFDDRLPDRSPAAIEEQLAQAKSMLDRALALEKDASSPGDRIAWSLLVEQLRAHVETSVCQSHYWSVFTLTDPVTRASQLPSRHAVRTLRDADTLLARYRAIAPDLRIHQANLQEGIRRNWVADRETVARNATLVEGQLEAELATWSLLTPAAARHPDWAPDELAAFRSELKRIVVESIRPAFEAYRDFLQQRLLPSAREPGRPGLSALPFGAACYRAQLYDSTRLRGTAEQLHSLGTAEIERTDAAFLQLGGKLFGEKSLATVLRRLREDPELRFDTSEEILREAEALVQRARAAAPRVFRTLPKSSCKVTPIPAFRASLAPLGYYESPSTDGTRSAEFFVNTSAPEKRVRFALPALTYHEAIPGHHLQIGAAQELSELPSIRKHGLVRAYVEGWGLYAEKLADEIGLYDGDLERLGMVGFDAWRAARLVVDTGLHAQGWSRVRAEQFMLEHTALQPEEIANEVDRYIAWPGQATSYKVGELEILRLRREAQEALGSAFDIRDFHAVVIGSGAVSLPVLAAEVADWLKRARSERLQ
jgi:uncharacterized protein (DUF885 family)